MYVILQQADVFPTLKKEFEGNTHHNFMLKFSTFFFLTNFIIRIIANFCIDLIFDLAGLFT